MKKIYLLIPILALVSSLNVQAQAQEPQRSININMSATEILPADLVIFNININAEAETPQKAFEMHKERESALASLLKKFKIKEKNINYDPIQINKRHRDEKDNTTVTRQSVSVTFSDFSVYEKIQVSLIENGFDSFNGQFSSTEIEAGKEKALIKAIEQARAKAELIAKAANVEIGEILNIHYSDHQIGFAKRSYAVMSAPQMEDSMMDFQQTVSVTANVNVNFRISS